ncbi:hypothetical protein QTP86_032837, partial [Hemibagrus guttatus]
MKCFKRLVMRHIKTQLPPSLDPLQFAYCLNCSMDNASLDPLQFVFLPNRSTDDAITTALHLSLTHLDNFCSAFNTIIPQHLIEKLSLLGLNSTLCNWILDFLTGRPQLVQHHHTEHWSPSGLCAQPTAAHFVDSQLCSNAQFKPHYQHKVTIPTYIDGSPVEIVKSTKFLGVHLAENFTWSLNTSSISKKSQQCLDFLREAEESPSTSAHPDH